MLIHHELNLTHSGTGFHHYLSYGQCPKRATLYAQRDEQEARTLPSSDGLLIGTLGHAYAELYYSGAVFEAEDVIFTPTVRPDALKEAQRVWSAYAERHSADEFDEILSIEEKLEGAAIDKVVGVPYTMKADLIIRLNSQQAADRLVKFRPSLAGIKPGVYGVDHKFLARRNSNMDVKYANSLQFVGYQLAWNALRPEQAVDGWIVNTVIKTKEVQFHSILVPPSSDQQVAALRSSLVYWKWMKDNNPQQTNPQDDYCFGFTEGCQHFLSGACDRSTSQLVQLGGLR